MLTRQQLCMARLNRDTRAIRNSVRRNTLQSSLYRWLVKNHDEFATRWAGKKIDWGRVCAELARLGETDTRGKPPTEANARKTWQRVRKAVAASRTSEAAQPPHPVYPSRVDKDWTPRNAPPPVNREAAPAAPALSLNGLMPIRKSASQDDDVYDPKAQKARLRRIIAERSGH
jgi:hypothetical protein